MTTKEKLKQMLVDCGMFESHADEVMDFVIPKLDTLVPEYRITWDRPASEYPECMFNVWWTAMKPLVLVWIDECEPKAWYKPLFMAQV